MPDMCATFLPYLHLMRLNKPIGIWLLFFPAAIAVCMARPGAPDHQLLLLMLIGAAITRSAGCVINDMTDRKLDAQVERTKNRPLASGAVRMQNALVLVLALGLAALFLLIFLPRAVLWLAVLVVPLIIAYPWMKRLTWWPQLFLGLTFNFGVPIGWIATGEPLTTATWLLYAGCLVWTLGYDTIYALQDMDDDQQVGIKSTALRLGKQVGRYVSGWYAGMLLCFMFAGLLAGTGPLYLVGIVLVALHARWQVRQVPFAKAERSAGILFRSNQWLGLALLAAIYLDRLLLGSQFLPF